MRICHVVYSVFPFDPRVRREVEGLRAVGHEVEIVCLRGEGQRAEEQIEGIRVHRVPLSVRRGGRLRYLFQYALFFCLSTNVLLGVHRRSPLQLVHIHSLPDFQVFCATFLRLRHVPVLLDLHELLPEIVAARFRLSLRSLLVQIATVAERLSTGFANHVIVANDTMAHVLSDRGVSPAKITVIMNSPDRIGISVGDASGLRRVLGVTEGPLVVYAGGINAERDLATLFRAVSILRETALLRVVVVGYGGTDYAQYLRHLVAELGIGNQVRFIPPISPEEVATYLALSTLGVVCYEDNPLTRVAVPTKSLEYAAAGKPMAMVDLPALRSLFDGAAEFYRAGDAKDLAASIERILRDDTHREKLITRARDILVRCSWDRMNDRLLSLYNSFVGASR